MLVTMKSSVTTKGKLDICFQSLKECDHSSIDKRESSHVNSKEIVFKFPDGQVKTIPMPVNKMLIAVAPYITKTHT